MRWRVNDLKGTELSHVKNYSGHTEGRRGNEKERDTNRGRGKTSSEGDVQTSRKKRSSQKMKRKHREV